MLESFTGFHGFVTRLRLDPDTQVLVVAESLEALQRAGDIILGETPFNASLAKPCIVINPELFPPSAPSAPSAAKS